jgi:hypothetical protein
MCRLVVNRTVEKQLTLKKITLPFLIFFICVTAGCQFRSTMSDSAAAGKKLQTAEGMIEYLTKQNLPAVESVEKWPNKYSEGLIITTDHYVIYTTLLEPLMLYQVPGFMESAYRGYQDQLPNPIETRTKFTIYLFATRQQWEDYTKTFTGPQAPVYLKIQRGAYFLKGICVAYNIGRTQTFSVLGHEGWHQFNDRTFRYRLPSWVDEGIAMLFETTKYEQGWFKFEPDKNMGRLGALKETLAKNKMIPLKELIGLNPGEVLIHSDTDAAMAFYAQSYALVRFLREEEYGKRLRNFHQLLLGGLRGAWPLEEPQLSIASDRNIIPTAGWNRQLANTLFISYIGDDFERLDREYVIFCRKLVYRIYKK